jgi:hypothetical protein
MAFFCYLIERVSIRINFSFSLHSLHTYTSLGGLEIHSGFTDSFFFPQDWHLIWHLIELIQVCFHFSSILALEEIANAH